MTTRGVLVTTFLAVALVGCSDGLPFRSGDDARYLEAGQALIEEELAATIGLGPLEASCRGRSLDAGDAFACTAMSDNQPPIEFEATISADGEGIDLTSTNLLLAERVEDIEAFAASLIADDTGRPIGTDDFECADGSLVVAPGQTIDCLVTDPDDATIHNVAVTVDDLESLSITVDVGEPVG